MMIFTVASLGEAETMLDYFNGFHDGFIKQFSIISHDHFAARGEQVSSQRLALEITFAHYNYQQDTRPAHQHIRASFADVMNLTLNFSGLSYEWSINYLQFFETQRPLEGGQTEACLGVSLVQSRLSAARQWELHEDVRFTCGRAEFAEL